MTEPMAQPMVWLPFDPKDLGEVPEGLRFDVVLPSEIDVLPSSAAEVQFYVLPYQFSPKDNEVMAEMPRLRVAQTLTAGIEHIVDAVPPDVTLCNGAGIHDDSTAELALTLILSSLNGIPGFLRRQEEHQWRPLWRDALADRRVLIVGYGRIGAAIEDRLRPFQVDVTRVARSARAGVHAVADLPDLLPAADVVVLILPATAESRGLVDAGFLAAMKAGALLVNVARGSIVDTDALVEALEQGRISAALDVTDPEPLPADHPLWRAPNLLLTPHVGGASAAMWPRAHRLVRAQLRRYLAGEPLGNVIPHD